ATAGAPFSGTVATFRDANPFGTASEFSATIHWGDGEVSVGEVRADGPGRFRVIGSHTYAVADKYDVIVEIADEGGSTAVARGTAKVSSLGREVQDDQTATESFWASTKGQTLINSF